MSEADLTAAILVALQAAGVMAMRNAQSTSRRRGHSGLPKGSADIVCVIYGRFVALEVKLPGGKLEPHQAEWGQRLRDHGGLFYCVTSIREAIDACADARRRSSAA